MTEVTCNRCGNRFDKKPSLIERSDNDFCSKECRKVWESGPWRDEKALREAYYEEGMQKKVAEKFGCSKSTIEKWMKRHDIQTYNGNPTRTLYDRKELERLYEEEQSIEGVLEKLPQTTSVNSVCDWLDNFDIETNPEHVTQGEKVNITCDKCGGEFTRLKSVIKGEHNFCGVNCRKSWWVNNSPSGEEHPSWKGGYNPNYSHGWTSARDEVRERDSVCRKCGADPDRELDVHHIQPVRTFDDPSDAHKLNNLVALCRSCHNKLEVISESEQRKILQ